MPSIPFFSLGALFFIFYKNKNSNIENSIFSKATFLFFVLVLIGYNYQNIILLLFFGMFILLFLVMIYKPKIISFLDNKLLQSIGASSYFLYLIHENIGVLLIYKFVFGSNLFSIISVLIIVSILITASYFYFKLVEVPIIKKLKQVFKS
jgi:peptidoglycan/LPS O-acetylase OafA/YrhL